MSNRFYISLLFFLFNLRPNTLLCKRKTLKSLETLFLFMSKHNSVADPMVVIKLKQNHGLHMSFECKISCFDDFGLGRRIIHVSYVLVLPVNCWRKIDLGLQRRRNPVSVCRCSIFKIHKWSQGFPLEIALVQYYENLDDAASAINDYYYIWTEFPSGYIPNCKEETDEENLFESNIIFFPCIFSCLWCLISVVTLLFFCSLNSVVISNMWHIEECLRFEFVWIIESGLIFYLKSVSCDFWIYGWFMFV